jgi:hypothetical protein
MGFVSLYFHYRYNCRNKEELLFHFYNRGVMVDMLVELVDMLDLCENTVFIEGNMDANGTTYIAMQNTAVL